MAITCNFFKSTFMIKQINHDYNPILWNVVLFQANFGDLATVNFLFAMVCIFNIFTSAIQT